ncbi:alpha/beta fold hydrolase [Paracoccaceae bacterium Fryx2]|nr:alpha/beta fold hydrolase [Paracoccaceae bacterium Fryx2]
MNRRAGFGLVNAAMLLVAVVAIALALVNLRASGQGVGVADIRIGHIPARVFTPAGGDQGPVVVIAHGFAGSQQLMQSFALAFARNGYTAVTFDFAGHGRNPVPLGGSITEVDGATLTLMAEVAQVADHARTLGDGRLAVLGHSMASDIVVRAAEADAGIAATIAVSMFSPEVTAESPRNLLVIVGDWEGTLKREALRAVGLARADPEPGVTYGDPAAGTGRRVVFSPHVEHASVLFSQTSLREAVAWLDAVFGVQRAGGPVTEGRGPWIMLLIAGALLLARPLERLLPVVVRPRAGAGLVWRRLALPVLLPMVATPLLLRVLPTHFLPVLVGDYLAAHFAVYGLLTAACLIWVRRGQVRPAVTQPLSLPALALGALGVTAYFLAALVWPINTYVTSFVPGEGRLVLLAVMLVGTALYFLADEWLTRGVGEGRFAYPASKLAFLGSLGLAVALDFERLFFLIIIVPVIVLFFIIHGLISRWAYRATGHPFVAGIANAVAFAWAIGVTFPLLAG